MSGPDPRLVLLREALSAYASDADDPPHPEREASVHAAVSVIVRAGETMDLLLIKRARHERDPWSGHMALPGGRRDPSDRSLLHTAARETLEETGVDLDASAHHLGRLAPVNPQSRRLPDLTIFPFVFGVAADTPARVASRAEVDAVHWVPLGTLRDPRTRSTFEVEVEGGVRSFPSLRLGDDAVWGLTYRILVDFFRVWPDDELSELRAG